MIPFDTRQLKEGEVTTGEVVLPYIVIPVNKEVNLRDHLPELEGYEIGEGIHLGETVFHITGGPNDVDRYVAYDIFSDEFRPERYPRFVSTSKEALRYVKAKGPANCAVELYGLKSIFQLRCGIEGWLDLVSGRVHIKADAGVKWMTPVGYSCKVTGIRLFHVLPNKQRSV